MKKRFKKVLVSLVASTMCITGSIGAMSAYAASCSTTNVALGYTNFSNDWSAIWTFSCGNYTGSMTVGFDTWWTDEDYVDNFFTWAGYHYAAVKNSIGEIENTNTVPAGSSTGKADVDHYGSPVTYYAYWNV